jgi:hypothetical protein
MKIYSFNIFKRFSWFYLVTKNKIKKNIIIPYKKYKKKESETQFQVNKMLKCEIKKK